MSGRRPRPEPQGHVRVGQVVGVFGVKGMLKVEPLTDFTARFSKGSLLYCLGESHKVVDSHWHDGQVRVMFEDLATVEEAQGLKWEYLTVPLADRPKLEEGEYAASELVGMEVTEGGKRLGTVQDVVHSPAHDLIQIEGALIPCVKQFVKRVDLERRVIEVELIEGLRPGDLD